MNPEITQLYNELEILKQKIDNFYRSSTIDREVETSLTERLSFPTVVGETTAGATTLTSAFSFNLPANPSGALQVTYKGKTYNLLYK